MKTEHILVDYMIKKQGLGWHRLQSGLADPRCDSQQEQELLLSSKTFRLVLGPTHPACSVSTVVLSLGHDVDHLPPSRAEVKNSGDIPLLPSMLSWHGEGQLQLFYLLCDETVVSTHNQCTDVQCNSLSSPAHTVVFILNWKALECI
jgi:hypothetical protein